MSEANVEPRIFRPEPGSELTFRPFWAANLFDIENSNVRRITQEYTAPSVEFILYSAKRLFFVEAKKTTPKPSPKSQEFTQYVDDLCEKFYSSLILLFKKVYVESDLEQADAPSARFRAGARKPKKIIFALVVATGGRYGGLVSLQEVLRDRIIKRLGAVVTKLVAVDVLALSVDEANAAGIKCAPLLKNDATQ